ncbi:MAG: methyltransferase [Acidobacteriota bacterium]
MLRHIIHDWTDEQSVGILKNCRKVMPANGRLLLVEAVVPPGNERSISKDFDFTMLMYPGGKERTEAEYRALYQASGFELKGITPTASVVSVIEGRPI